MQRLTFVLALLALLGGCLAPAAVSLAPAALDQRAKAFEPPHEQAMIYVVRQPGTAILGGFVAFPVTIDGTALGAVAPGTYLVLSVAPWLHRVTAVSRENSAAQTVRVDAGQVVFVTLVPQIGLSGPRVVLDIMDEAAGRTSVQGTALGQAAP